MKKMRSRKVTISYMVANILAVESPEPYPVLSITIKHVNPAILAAIVPMTLSRLFPKLNVT